MASTNPRTRPGKPGNPGLLMSSADGSFTQMVLPDDQVLPERITNDYGITVTDASYLARLTFAGKSTDALMSPHLVTREILTALPDLVLLHAQLGAMIDQAKAAGLLTVPDDFAPIISRQD